MSKFCLFVCYLLVLILSEKCTSILIPQQPEPTRAYTAGIKTVNWKKSNIQTHQNYSKVNVHNNPNAEAHYVLTQTQETQKIYPVYSDHSYGLTHQNVLETKSHSNIDPNEFPKSNRTIFKRKIEYKSLEVYEKCPPGVTGQFVYAFSCNQYLNCWKGRGVPQNCAPGTLFNPKTSECDFPDKVQCITGPSLNTLANIRVAKSVTQASCPEGFSGLIPNYTDCSKFINCNNGHSVPMDCPPGTLFDIKQNICNHPQTCTCFNGQSGSDQPAGYHNQGIDHQTTHGQTHNCDLSTNCGRDPYQIGQGQSNQFHQSGTRINLYPYNQNQGQTYNFSVTYGSSCNPQYQNCGQQHGQSRVYGHTTNNLGFGEAIVPITGEGDGQSNNQNVAYGVSHTNVGYGQAPNSNSGQAIIESFGHTKCNPLNGNCIQNAGGSSGTNRPNCDPSLHNCAQGTEQSLYPGYDQIPTYTYIPGKKCNPLTHNCGHSQSSSQTTTYTSGQICNPAVQNCGQGQGAIRSSTLVYTPGQSCNPAIQDCRQDQGTIRSPTPVYRPGQNCNPAIQDCGQGQGPIRSPTPVYRPGQNCNPAIQDCGQGPTLVYTPGQNCNPAIQDCGQGQGPNRSPTPVYIPGHPCNPATQNCGQVSISSPTSGYTPGQNCNPAFQNCGQSQGTQTTTYVPGRNCNPALHNCGQGQGSIKQDTVYTHIQNCNPSIENCGQSNVYGGSSNTEQAFSYGIGQKCDPASHNCVQSSTDGQISYGQSPHSQNVPQQQTSGQFFCNPKIQDCRQNTRQTDNPEYISSQTTLREHPENRRITIHSQTTGRNCNSGTTNCGQNYNRICNINDPNCQNGHNIVTRRTEPKCPDGYQGLTKHPTDCKKFLNCANGQTFIQDCAPGTLFNPKLGNCDFPYNVDCQKSSSGSDYNYGDNWERHHEANGQNEDIISSSGKTKNDDQKPGSHPKWDQTNIYDQSSITDTDRGEIGLVSRPVHRPTTERSKQNEQKFDQTAEKFPDYVDIFDPKERHPLGQLSTTPRSVWPPPFPKTVNEVDYEFEYEDGEPVTLEPDDINYAEEKKSQDCQDDDFHCSNDLCISITMVCDGRRDCQTGEDEMLCEEYIGRFSVAKNSQLVVLENQRWVNASYATCAMLCIKNEKFTCRSFNYRKSDRTCFLSDKNVGLTGALRQYFPMDYYEVKAGTVDCSNRSRYFECSNKKCLLKEQLCDGADDCGDRQDEKNCKPEDFGYSIKLAGTKEKNEGRIEVTAFRKTGYICDDQFGIEDANVICKELGFELGAAEIRGQSYFAKDLKERNTLYMMDEVDCFGNETTLLDCGFSGWGVHNCRDQEIAGVVCKTPQEKCGKGYWKCDTGNECVPYDFVCDGVNDCSDDSDEGSQHCEAPTEIRLVNGSRSSEGRLEIKHHGIWGTVCDDDFNEDAAKVVCQYFGFRGKSTVKKEAYFGAGDGPIWLDQVSCFGNETELHKCTHWNWGEHNCEHSEDVGVICSNEIDEVDVQRNTKLPVRYETGLPTRCGFRKDNLFVNNDLVHARVVSGSVAKIGEYPWQAALKVRVKDKSAHWCGAVIISSKWVLTAAHCLQGYTKGAYVVVAGEYNTDEEDGTEQQKYIEEFFIHERFRDGHRMNNDIALIKVKGGGFALNDDVQPICLPDPDTVYSQDMNCTISGFGSVKSGTSAYSHNMMAAWIPIHSNEICRMPHVYGDALTDGMICAGFLDGGVDSCDGDSGGPLACLDQGFFTLYGLTSWGQHCGYANKPGVYVKVARYRAWIEDIILKHSE